MAYSSSDIDNLIDKYLNSKAGQKALKNQGFYSEAQLIKLGEKLKTDLITEFLESHHHTDPSPTDYFTGVSVKIISPKGEAPKIRIWFPAYSLKRMSLLRRDGKLTGAGVPDVFGLITRGWSARKQVYGYWSTSDYKNSGVGDGDWTASKQFSPANPFIQRIISKFTNENPGITVTYPDEWK